MYNSDDNSIRNRNDKNRREMQSEIASSIIVSDRSLNSKLDNWENERV